MVRFRVDESVTDEDAGELWPVYQSVFGDQPSQEAWQEAVWDRHRVREGFRLARAYDSSGALVGFAYGYVGGSGQWWTDSARTVLEPDIAERWLGGHFELVSVGVAQDARGRGIGRGLMHALLDDLAQDRLLRMTVSDPSDPARRLYASEGWQVLGPGLGEATVIMGKAVDRTSSRG